MLCATILLIAAFPQARADVTFDNLSKFKVYVFLKGNRKTYALTKPRASASVPDGFAVGDNYYVVIRDAADDERGRPAEYALFAPKRHMVYPAAAGRGPNPVNIDITNAFFKTLKKKELTHAIRIENNTDYPVSVVAHGQVNPIGLVPPRSTNTFDKKLSVGRTELLVNAYSRTMLSSGMDVIVDIAFTSVEVAPGERGSKSLVITDKTFGKRGLPAIPSATPTPAERPSLEGTWRMPDGLSVRFEGKYGYWVEIGYLKDFGFKTGDLGFKDLEEDPNKPGTFNGKVLYRLRGGREDGWRAFSITVRDKNTLSNSAGVWKRIEPSAP